MYCLLYKLSKTKVTIFSFKRLSETREKHQYIERFSGEGDTSILKSLLYKHIIHCCIQMCGPIVGLDHQTS